MAAAPSAGLDAPFELERYLADTQGTGAGLPELERESVRRGREIVRLALQTHLDARSPGDVGRALLADHPDGTVRLGEKRLQHRRIVTIVGELSLRRLGYAAPGHKSIHPLDAELCQPSRSFSYEVQRHLARAAVCRPFEEAVRTMGELSRFAVLRRNAEQIVLDAACDFETFYAGRSGASLEDAALLVGAVDGRASRW